jgi:ABC-type uncharacterized transport system YnjBCD substrate-binding protein
LFCSQKYDLEWDLQQLRLQEDDFGMTVQGRSRGEESRVDEDPFKKQMQLWYEAEVRASTSQTYGKPQVLDQLQEWIKKNPNPYISNDNFSQEGIFHGWASARARSYQPNVP